MNTINKTSHIIARSEAAKQSPGNDGIASGKERPRNDRSTSGGAA